jgi:rhodanese-related sulfurtransferase
MTVPSVTPSDVRRALLLRDEIGLLDVRHEAAFATGHPLFAANMAADRITLEAGARLPRKDVPIVLYDAGEGLVAKAADRLTALGYTDIRQLGGGLQAWQVAGYELFIDVNSYAKAFGELVESRRHTPSLPADEVAALIADGANIAILDVRRFDEYATMNIPGSVSVPGAELVLRAGSVAPDPETTIIVNCAGRTRSIIGTQSLINAGVANKVMALRNGTIGWTLAKRDLEHGADRRSDIGLSTEAQTSAREVAYRAGVRHLGPEEALALERQIHRTLYRFDVRTSEDFRRRSHSWISALSGRAVGAGDRHGGPGAWRAHSADRRQGGPRRHDRLLARANGLGDLRARGRLRPRIGAGAARGLAEAGSVAALPASL